MAAEPSVTTALLFFEHAFENGRTTLGPSVHALMGMMVTFEIVFAGLYIALGEIPASKMVARKILTIGFLYWIIDNYTQVLNWVLQGFLDVGQDAVGASGLTLATLQNPDQIFMDGVTAVTPAVNKLLIQWHYSILGIPSVDMLLLLFTVIISLLAFGFIAIQVFVIYLEFLLVTAVGFALIPFGVFKPLSWISERVFGAIINLGVKLLVLGLIIALIHDFMPEVGVAKGVGWQQMFHFLVVALALAYLSFHAPGLAASLFSGAPQFALAAVASTATAAKSSADGSARGAGATVKAATSGAARAAGAAYGGYAASLAQSAAGAAGSAAGSAAGTSGSNSDTGSSTSQQRSGAQKQSGFSSASNSEDSASRNGAQKGPSGEGANGAAAHGGQGAASGGPAAASWRNTGKQHARAAGAAMAGATWSPVKAAFNKATYGASEFGSPMAESMKEAGINPAQQGIMGSFHRGQHGVMSSAKMRGEEPKPASASTQESPDNQSEGTSKGTNNGESSSERTTSRADDTTQQASQSQPNGNEQKQGQDEDSRFRRREHMRKDEKDKV